MPDLISLLQSSERQVRTGIVVGNLGNGRYSVTMSGRTLPARSATGQGLAVGSRVVVSMGKNSRYIVGTTRQVHAQTHQEVVIDG